MATRTCRECTTVFAVGLPACPHCQSEDHEETGMAKITVAHGATYTAKEQEALEWPSETNSSASTKKQPSTPETSETTPQPPARSTENRSSKGRKASSSASSTATSGPATGDSDKK